MTTENNPLEAAGDIVNSMENIEEGTMSSWYYMLKEEVKMCGDNFENLTHTLDDVNLHRYFSASSYGIEEGTPFTAWTENWVYFPVCYDGKEWVGSVPRNPCDISTEHQGGG